MNLSIKTLSTMSAAMDRILHTTKEKIDKENPLAAAMLDDKILSLLPENLRRKAYMVKRELEEAKEMHGVIQSSISELIETVPKFKEVHENNCKMAELLEAFDKAEPWSREEREAMDKVRDHLNKFEEYLGTMGEKVGVICNHEQYYQEWDKKHFAKFGSK